MLDKPFGTRPMTIDELSFILTTTNGNWRVFVGKNKTVPFGLFCNSNYVYLALTDAPDAGMNAHALWEAVDQEAEAMRVTPAGIEHLIDTRNVFADSQGKIAIVDVEVSQADRSITLLTKEA
jgi:hypothetical protein